MYLGILTACMSIYHILEEAREGVGSPGTGVTGGYESSRELGIEPEFSGIEVSVLIC